MDNQNAFGQSRPNFPAQAPAQGQPGAVPPPPSVTVRTAQSDLSSMMSSGGQAPTPEKVILPQEPADANAKFSNFSASGGKIPPSQKPGVPPSPISPSPKKSPLKWIIILVIVIIILGVGGYFAYSFLMPSASITPPAALPTPPVVPPAQPSTPPTSTLPSAATTTATTTLLHKSFLKIPADQNLAISFSSSTGLDGLRSALINVVPSNSATSGFYEVAINDANNQPLKLTDFLPILTSAYVPEFLSANFQPDFTFFIYKDANGVWPGIILGLNQTTTVVSVQSTVKKIETASLSSFYFSSPGNFGPFKDGALNGKPTRYSFSTTKGVVFNYGFIDRYLVFGTTYNGFKEAVRRLGF